NLCRVTSSQAGRRVQLGPWSRDAVIHVDLRHARSIRSRFETSDLRPDESTTNIGLFQSRNRLRPRVRRQAVVTLVGPHAKASRPASTPHRGPLSWGYGLRTNIGWEVYSRNAPGPPDRIDRLGLRHRAPGARSRCRRRSRLNWRPAIVSAAM